MLIVEDDPLIGLDLESELERAGFVVVGIATTVAGALRLFEVHGCDVAVLDVHLGRETSAGVATVLAGERVPFVAVTGYSSTQCPPEFKTVLLLPKPFHTGRLVAELRQCLTEEYALPARGGD